MPSATETRQIVLRDVEGIEEIRQIEDLQIRAWGDDEREIVPLNQLVAARYVGGSVIGAFDRNKLVGFVYGFYGHIAGSIVHHSHMLAVHPAYRNHNLAFRLKLAQREHVLADGFTDRITWTFDPLQSLNAHFNFAKLGVVADTYKINVYGETGTSFLHRNGTDRFFVTWLIDSPRVNEMIAGARPAKEPIVLAQNALRLLRCSESGTPEREADVDRIPAVDLISIEIPADINSIEQADFDMARKWREETRLLFSESLAAGSIVFDYVRQDDRFGLYLLRKARIDDFSRNLDPGAKQR